MTNPFKFGSVVDGDFFTNRTSEKHEIEAVLKSSNHLILVSPRRYGKTSLISRVTSDLDRPTIYLDLQLVTDVSDMATQLLKRVLKLNKWEKVRHHLSNFRIVPTIEINPRTDAVEVSFSPSVSDSFIALEDVLNLIEKIGEKGKRVVVVLDEFQEITSLSKTLPKQLRAVIQHHSNINYVFLGSVESMMRRVFETKKSPFYHFGVLMTLGRIPYDDFREYLSKGLSKLTLKSDVLASEILTITSCHPYYTQQLGFYCYTYLEDNKYQKETLSKVIERIIELRSKDYDQLWNTLNKTDKKLLITLASDTNVSNIGIPTSTVYSGLSRLTNQGYLINNGSYTFDDPFFKKWIIKMRSL